MGESVYWVSCVLAGLFGLLVFVVMLGRKRIKVFRLTKPQKSFMAEMECCQDATSFDLLFGVEIFGKLHWKRFLRAVKRTKQFLHNLRIYRLRKLPSGEYLQVEYSDKEFVRRWNERNMKKKVPEIPYVKDLPEIEVLLDFYKDEKVLDLSKTTKTSVYQIARNLFLTRLRTPQDVTGLQLTRLSLVQYAKDKYIFTLHTHHIISDGLSGYYFFDLVSKFYNNYFFYSFYYQVRKTLFGWFPDISKYLEYEKSYSRKQLNTDLKYWGRKLKNGEFKFPWKKKLNKKLKPIHNEFSGGQLYHEIRNKQYEAIKNLVKETRSTLFIVLSALYSSFLFTQYGRKDVILEYVTSLRPKNWKFLTSCLINDMFLRVKFDSKCSIVEVIDQIKRDRLEDRKRNRIDQTDLRRYLKREGENISVEDNGCETVTLYPTFLWFGGKIKMKNLKVTRMVFHENDPTRPDEIEKMFNLLYEDIGGSLLICFEYRNILFYLKEVVCLKEKLLNFFEGVCSSRGRSTPLSQFVSSSLL